MSYFPNPELMATVICQHTLRDVRVEVGTSYINEWQTGRVEAAALIFPSIENISAANEVRFLTGRYARRHFGSRK